MIPKIPRYNAKTQGMAPVFESNMEPVFESNMEPRGQPGGLRELKPPPSLARSKLRKKIRSFNF